MSKIRGKILEWQYPLYKKSDKIAYSVLEKIGKYKKYPRIIGSQDEINTLLKQSIVSQKMKDYRIFRDIVLSELKKDELIVKNILNKSIDIKITKGIDKSWAIFTQDKKICRLIDNVSERKINFKGGNDEIIEFIVKFWLSQLLFDWRGPLMAIIIECLNYKDINIQKLNDLLKNWDYTKIF